MFGWYDGSGGSAGWRETGTGAGGRGISVGRKLSKTGGEEDHGVCGAGAGRQERQRHFAEHEKSSHASDAGADEKCRRTALVSQTEVAGRASVRMDQARAGLPALQLAGPQESASRVAIGLRGVKPEENRRPDYHLTATGKARKRCSAQEGKSIRRFRSHCTPKAPQVDFRNCSVGQTPRRLITISPLDFGHDTPGRIELQRRRVHAP